MNTEQAAERITIEGRIQCCTTDGHPWTVLQWRRQTNGARSGEDARWQSVGPAVFTLFDASAVIQIGGSALQIVSTGKVLHVMDPDNTFGSYREATAGLAAQRAAARGTPLAAAHL